MHTTEHRLFAHSSFRLKHLYFHHTADKKTPSTPSSLSPFTWDESLHRLFVIVTTVNRHKHVWSVLNFCVGGFLPLLKRISGNAILCLFAVLWWACDIQWFLRATLTENSCSLQPKMPLWEQWEWSRTVSKQGHAPKQWNETHKKSHWIYYFTQNKYLGSSCNLLPSETFEL